MCCVPFERLAVVAAETGIPGQWTCQLGDAECKTDASFYPSAFVPTSNHSHLSCLALPYPALFFTSVTMLAEYTIPIFFVCSILP